MRLLLDNGTEIKVPQKLQKAILKQLLGEGTEPGNGEAAATAGNKHHHRRGWRARRWTTEEDNIILAGTESGASIPIIAREVGRSTHATYLRKLKLQRDMRAGQL